MTTRQRIELIARTDARLFPRAALLRLVRQELGQVEALDRWITRDGVEIRACAPRLIYHVCAGNLAVSAITSLVHGLLIGSGNVMKLPGTRDDSTARREILAFVARLPAPLRRLVKIENAIDPATFARADVVVAFGSDATMESLRARTHARQRFIPHGHALSLLWIENPAQLSTREVRACAIDVLTYDQLGCLSPQAIYVPPRTNIKALGDKLAAALETEWRRIASKPGRPLAVAARIAEAREVAFGLGHRLWLPPRRHLGWTLVHDPEPAFRPSPLHGVIYLRTANEAGLRRALAPLAGRISTIGCAGKTSSRWERLFLSLSVSRFCPAGRMQFPPLTWHHDGRSALGELVTWIDAERST
jgi:acyl-CoA reductase LuxC